MESFGAHEFDVRTYFAGLDYPAHRDDLVRVAILAGARPDVVRLLRSLPNRSFNGSAQVRRALALAGTSQQVPA